ncbi:MAG: hypothetical protein V1919_00190, partial [Candidatus Omnitrophota bacterium]
MKRIMLFVISALFICSTSAFAAMIDCSGVVNPNYNNSWDEINSGIARYTFYFENDPSINVNQVNFRFESDIFNLGELGTEDFSVVNPSSGWETILLSTSSNGAEWYLTSGSAINASQGPIVVDVRYVLLNSDRMFAASGSGWNWDEGQAWGQSFCLLGPNGEVGPGSTA